MNFQNRDPLQQSVRVKGSKIWMSGRLLLGQFELDEVFPYITEEPTTKIFGELE